MPSLAGLQGHEVPPSFFSFFFFFFADDLNRAQWVERPQVTAVYQKNKLTENCHSWKYPIPKHFLVPIRGTFFSSRGLLHCSCSNCQGHREATEPPVPVAYGEYQEQPQAVGLQVGRRSRGSIRQTTAFLRSYVANTKSPVLNSLFDAITFIIDGSLKSSVIWQAYNSKHICTKCKIHTVQAREYKTQCPLQASYWKQTTLLQIIWHFLSASLKTLNSPLCCFPIDQLLHFMWVLLLVCEYMLSVCFPLGQTFPAVCFLDLDYFYYLLYVAMEMGRSQMLSVGIWGHRRHLSLYFVWSGLLFPISAEPRVYFTKKLLTRTQA